MFSVAVLSAYAVPPVLNYAGQVAVNGQPFEGDGLFKFALVNSDGKITYWSNDGTSVNGSEPQASVKVPVSGGLYSLLLGNTAIQGMGAINPQVFAQHGDAKLRVWFSDGVNGFQQLSPDRPFASVPYAFSAGTAQSAGSATIADGSINKSMLGSDVIADLNKSVTITRDMLPQDVRDDLNKSVTITRSMLPADVLSDLNRTISKSMLGSDVLADLNKSSSSSSPITLSMLAPEVTAKLDQNGSGGSGVVAGSLISVPHGQPAPSGYSLYQRAEPKALVWEEKAPVSVARFVADGCSVLNGKIYFAGGSNGPGGHFDIMEEYDPATNIWRTLSPLSSPRSGVSLFTLQDKLFAIGGDGVGGRISAVETFYPSNNMYTPGPTFPHVISYGNSIELNGIRYLIGGNNQEGKFATNYIFENNASTWEVKAPMSKARSGQGLVVYEGHIWAMGGGDGSNSLDLVESYDPVSNLWQSEPSLPVKKQWASAWVANGKIYIAGGKSDVFERSIFSFSRETGWVSAGNLPENKYGAGTVVVNDQIYIIAGQTASSGYSNKVYAADLNASMAGVYDLYRKDGNASAGTPLVQAEVADGSVTTAKLDATILKYLKPEITSQPQAQTVYADSNVSYSVIAEGKYLTYQWKKDGSNLTGENNSTLIITDANATLHDGNYSVVVSNDFGSVESAEILVDVNTTWATDGLVGWWKFDEGSGMVANDSSGNGNDGNLMNGPTWSIGKIGGALSFDGVDDFVFLGNPPEIGLSGNQSFSMWLKPFSFDARRNPYSKAYGGTGTFTLEPNKVMSYFYGISGSDSEPHGTYRTTSLVSLNEWNNLVLTRNLLTLTVRFFLNGLLDVSLNAEHATASIDSLNAKIGDGYTSPFHGLIDDFRIYNRALSAAEVQALYNMGQ